MKKGVHAFYNYDYEKSLKILGQARQDYPENPLVHITWAAARWRRNEAFLSQTEIYENLNSDLEEVESVYKKLLEKYPDHPEYLLYLGSTRGLKARILLGQKKWFGTLSAAYQGFRVIQKAVELDPNLKDAQLPIGIMEYYAGLSNFMVKFAASVFGLNPSREEGIRKMEIAANESEWAWSEAKSILSFIYLWVDIDPRRGLEVSADLVDHYPRNFDFQIHYVESLLQTGDLKAGQKRLSELNMRMVELTPRQKRWYTSYLNYEWGHYYFIQGNLDKALHHLDISIRQYDAELDAILANAWLRKGMIYDLQGERMEAVTAYKACLDLDNYTRAMSIAEKYISESYLGEVVVESSLNP